jgi:hypothetical protein
VSSSSTNKQPLLVDRPLHAFAVLGPVPCLADDSNFATVLGAGCSLLVDCSDSDGAVVDSLSIVATQANTSQVSALFFLSNAPSVFGITDTNTALVAGAVIQSGAPGIRTNVSLPPLSIPVPNLGAQTALTEFDKKNTGLYVPAGFLLYTGLSNAILAPTPLTKVNVFAQGGYF